MTQKENFALIDIKRNLIKLIEDNMTLEMVLRAFTQAAEHTSMYDKVGDTYYNAKKLLTKYCGDDNIYSGNCEID